MYTEKDHTFALCAYGECEYLECTIHSLLLQNKKSTIIIVTSTPNQHIKSVSSKYNLPLYIRKGENDIAKDWNYAFHKATTKLVTICHQDDIYSAYYTEEVVRWVNKNRNVLIVFSNYWERINEKKRKENCLIKIKKIMLIPLKYLRGRPNMLMRRVILSLGNPICCPSVTYVKENLPKKIFKSGFKSNLDWDAWERISMYDGNFIYIPEKLIEHRIHTNSTTSILIANKERTKEDLCMFCRFWPKFLAKILNRLYHVSETFNHVGEMDK
ncbi:MAG: glycosyltransferase family 2 protein [Lachnospiraceae bacterium]|nr:glycosyltransferase family 2 protein [Lachnospiraceae bacterium]